MAILDKISDSRATSDEDAIEIYLLFHCPGCKMGHHYQIKGPKPWNWNGSMEKPTFTPALLVWASRPDMRCHLWVTDGQIQFLDDCHHALKGQTVPMVDLDKG